MTEAGEVSKAGTDLVDDGLDFGIGDRGQAAVKLTDLRSVFAFPAPRMRSGDGSALQGLQNTALKAWLRFQGGAFNAFNTAILTDGLMKLAHGFVGTGHSSDWRIPTVPELTRHQVKVQLELSENIFRMIQNQARAS